MTFTMIVFHIKLLQIESLIAYFSIILGFY